MDADAYDRGIAETDTVSRARAAAVARAHELGQDELAPDVALVVTELVTNALLHGGGCVSVDVTATDDRLRVEVVDNSRMPPVFGHASDHAMTGRGMLVVSSVATRWGAEPRNHGKVVWAELTAGDAESDLSPDELLALWDDWGEPHTDRLYPVRLGDVPTDLLLAAKSHVDGVVREFALASSGAQSGLTEEVPPHLASLLRSVVERFSDARLAIKHQALEAARRNSHHTDLTLELPLSAADAAEEYMLALDELDAYSRAARLLTLETPPQHRAFRHWYIEELVVQLRAAAAGEKPRRYLSFQERLLGELDRLAEAQRSSERAARLYSAAVALATAGTPEAVADAVLTEGVAALGASAGGMLLATEADRLALPGATGYDEDVLERLRTESRDAELPAAVALRTGAAVWLESREERDARFPELVGLEPTTVSLCAVPLEVQGRRLGALRFSFRQARLFDEDERRFVQALAAQTAQALERAQLQRARFDASRRLQRSLLPPRLPTIPGIEVAAVYHPFGDGMEVGGDFYDVWSIKPGQWGVAIGDVSGTGPEAAGLTALVRHTIRALSLADAEPHDLMTTLNRTLLEATGGQPEAKFCTAIFGLLEEKHLRLTLAGGGHPPVTVRRADGSVESIIVGGALLGVFASAAVECVTVDLRPGDTMVLVTDGVLEARRDMELFDTDGLEAVLASAGPSAGDTAEALEQAVLAHTGGTLTDDMAIVVLHVTG